MASPIWWAWVWVNSGSWWWTGRPGVLWFMGSQRVRHNWATELNWTERDPTEFLYPFHDGKVQREGSLKDDSCATSHTCTLILDLQPPKIWEKNLFFFFSWATQSVEFCYSSVNRIRSIGAELQELQISNTFWNNYAICRMITSRTEIFRRKLQIIYFRK